MGHKLRCAVAPLLLLTAVVSGHSQANKTDPPKEKSPKPAQVQQTTKKLDQTPAQKPAQAVAPKPVQVTAPKAPQVAAPKPTQAIAPKGTKDPAKPAQAPATTPTKAPAQGTQAGASKPAQTAAPKPTQSPAQADKASPPKSESPKPAQSPKAPVEKPGQADKAKPAKGQSPKPEQKPDKGDKDKAQTAEGAAKKPAKQPAQKPLPKPTQKPTPKPMPKPARAPVPKHGRVPPHLAQLPAFLDNPDVIDFIGRMVVSHGFDVDTLKEQFSMIAPNIRALTLFRPVWPPPVQQPRQTPPKGTSVQSWKHYSAPFLNSNRIASGVTFWRENAETIEKASNQYGVPPEIIVAIIGVETLYGQHKGGFRVMEALASLAFHDPKRGDFFREELENFLLLARENGFDPLKTQGSYAGAIGIPQFMPKSWRRFAIDYDGDGRIDLDNNIADSIGSVANYMKEYGWQKGEPVADRATLSDSPDPAWAAAGMLPSLSVKELKAAGVKIEGDDKTTPALATFIELPTPGLPTEYWLGYGNYYVITRYNRSHYYSMSVFLLAELLRDGVGQ